MEAPAGVEGVRRTTQVREWRATTKNSAAGRRSRSRSRAGGVKLTALFRDCNCQRVRFGDDFAIGVVCQIGQTSRYRNGVLAGLAEIIEFANHNILLPRLTGL